MSKVPAAEKPFRITKDGQFTFASDEGLLEAFRAEHVAAAGRRRHLGRQLSFQAFMNGLLLEYLSRPRAQRERRQDEGLDLCAECELGHLAVDEVAAMGDEEGAGVEPGKPRVAHARPAAVRRRREAK